MPSRAAQSSRYCRCTDGASGCSNTLRSIPATIDEEGALLDFDYREVQAAQAIIANARSVMLVADSTKLRRSAPVRIAHLSQIQTFVTDAALPAGIASICHSRGIEVIEAMPSLTADIDEPGVEPASTVTRLR